MAKTALALGGGGARGLAHVGVLKVFEREKIPLYQITGCSMGAIIGGAYCLLNGDALATEKFIYDIITGPAFGALEVKIFSPETVDDKNRDIEYYLNSAKKYFSLIKTINKPAVYDQDTVDAIMEPFADKPIEDLPIRFACIATDLISGREIVINEGSMKKAITASASIPGIFPPVKMDQQLLVDGGATDSIPVQIVKGQGAQYVLAVDVTKSIEDVDELDNALQIMYRAEDIVTYHLTKERLSGADLIISPDVHHYSWAAVHLMEKIIAAGEKAAEKQLPEIKRILGKFYKPFELARITSLISEAIACHMGECQATSLEAKIVEVADGTDITKGRARIPFHIGIADIHKFSALAIEKVTIKEGKKKPLKIEILMDNPAGIFQAEETLLKKIRDAKFEEFVEVIAKIKGEKEVKYL